METKIKLKGDFIGHRKVDGNFTLNDVSYLHDYMPMLCLQLVVPLI